MFLNVPIIFAFGLAALPNIEPAFFIALLIDFFLPRVTSISLHFFNKSDGFKKVDTLRTIFKNFGKNDITHHINFSIFKKVINNFGNLDYNYTTQKKFLIKNLKWGVTLHKISYGIDNGKIWCQKEIKFNKLSTSVDLYETGKL